MENSRLLEFNKVTLSSASLRVNSVSDVSISLNAGEFALILVDAAVEHVPIADLAEGLATPDEGFVTFCGERWNEMTTFRQCEMRGRIGRVFERDGWVSNLTVCENIALSQRHHTQRAEDDIHAEIDELRIAVGIPDVADQRPDFVPNNILRRAEWMRAFLGNPALVILERAEDRAPADSLPKLIEILNKSLSRGSGAIWITADVQIWNSRCLARARRYRMNGTKLVQAGEEKNG